MSESDPLRETFERELEGVTSLTGLEELRLKYLGKKGILSDKLKLLPSLSPEERKSFGQSVNDLKKIVEEAISSKRELFKLNDLREKFLKDRIDITLPGKTVRSGSLHPITLALNEIIDIFTGMGFTVEEGPEVETDYYNFEALNMPPGHPARDMQDTFYISDELILRTHTSPVQVRVMEKRRPPLRCIAPGKVYRCDADISHTPMFHQVEGFMVGNDISFSHLKAVLEAFIHKIFSPDVPVRFRPSYFPFTEPSAEVDIGCIFCGESGCRTCEGTGYAALPGYDMGAGGCRVCKGSGWIEILGAGMINPKVFEMAGYPPAEYTGFAFGMGVERIAMLKYSIDDIRMFFENDIRFLSQF